MKYASRLCALGIAIYWVATIAYIIVWVDYWLPQIIAFGLEGLAYDAPLPLICFGIGIVLTMNYYRAFVSK